MGERRGTKGLELWCRRMTEGYPGVKIDNMTTSWRDGLAFCAIIHHFRPELIDFSTLKKNDVYYNNDLAFTVAEKYLGIPALLEAADMVQYDVPDRLSILTYLSQFYRAFVASQGTSPSRTVPKRPASASDRGLVSPASTSPPTKMAVKSGGMPRRDPCAKCGLPVFIAERLSVGKLLYHRTCFRCARCNSQLTLANYYETETQNQFCCETCPDEESKKENAKCELKSIVARSLSDEEKSASLNKTDEGNDAYSTLFETALEDPDDPSLKKSGTLNSVKSSEFIKARSYFISSQIENSDSDEEMPPELPKTKPPDKSEVPKLERIGRSETIVPKDLNDRTSVNNVNYESNSGFTSNTHSLDSDVNISAKINISNQLKTASVQLGKNNEFVTKEIQSAKEESPSLVKMRSRLFEKPATISKKPLKTSANIETPSNVFKTLLLRPKFSQSTGNIFTPEKLTTPSVPKSPVNKYNFDRRRSLTEGATLVAEKQTFSEKKEPRSLQANSPIFQRVHSLTSIFQIQSPEKRKSSPLPEKRASNTPLQISSPQKYPPLVTAVIKPNATLRTTSSESSLNSLLEKQLSKKLKTSTSDLTKMFEGEAPKPESPQLRHKPLAIYRSNNKSGTWDLPQTKHLSLKNDEVSPTLKAKTNLRETKTILSKERNEEKFVSVSALKNLFENSEINKPFDNPELIIEVDGPKSVKAVSLEPVNASIDSDITNFSEHQQVAIAETLGNENIKQNYESPNEQVTANHLHKPDVAAVGSFENMMPSPQKKEDVDDTRTETKDIALDDIQTRSDNSSNNVVELINVNCEVIELKDTNKESMSHPNTDDAVDILDDSDDGPVAKNKEETTSQYIKSDIIVLSDETIEISDSSIPVIEVSDEISTHDKTNREYPEDLNPFDDGDVELAKYVPEKSLNPFDEDIEEQEIVVATPKPAARKKYPTHSESFKNEDKSLNPFDGDEDDEQVVNITEDSKSPKPATRKIIHPIELENIFESPNTIIPEHLKTIYIKRISINPNEELKSPCPVDIEPPRQLKLIAPPLSLNPFWSDDEGEETEDKPVPKPRKSKNTPFTPEPKPRTSGRSLISSSHGSSISISSANTSGQTIRKKKPAPRPPAFVSEVSESGHSSLTSSPSTSVQHSPRLTPKIRKIKKAPPPPTSTPYLTAPEPSLNFSAICDKESSQENLVTLQGANLVNSDEWEKEKIVKDEVNRNRQSQYFTPPSPTLSQKEYLDFTRNKSTYGKWKRKKGPAPSRPVPQRRLIKALPTTEIRRELDLIELQQQGLEKQGVRLEQIIRDRCEGPENSIDDTVPIDVEDLILQLFEVVNEKNELCRKQAELMYLQRQQRLEEEHADVEYQIRCLMLQPEANKTDSDKAREEELINRLVDIVERRNEIIECLEMDRIREAEEDDSICNSLNTYASKRDENVKSEPEILSKKEKKKTKKEKKNKLKNAQIADIDKDVDESESFYVAPSKDKKKKKFALF